MEAADVDYLQGVAFISYKGVTNQKGIPSEQRSLHVRRTTSSTKANTGTRKVVHNLCTVWLDSEIFKFFLGCDNTTLIYGSVEQIDLQTDYLKGLYPLETS